MIDVASTTQGQVPVPGQDPARGKSRNRGRGRDQARARGWAWVRARGEVRGKGLGKGRGHGRAAQGWLLAQSLPAARGNGKLFWGLLAHTNDSYPRRVTLLRRWAAARSTPSYLRGGTADRSIPGMAGGWLLAQSLSTVTARNSARKQTE